MPDTIRDFEAIVLGCGVGGLSAAKLLLDGGRRNVLVADPYPSPGGNQISRDLNGFTFDIGAFYFWPSMPLFALYPQVAARCPQRDVRVARVGPGGTVGPFPFCLKQEFLARGPRYWMRALASMAQARFDRRPFVSAEDYAVYWMGRRLYQDLGMADYITRFFGVPADRIEAQFAESRLEFVARFGMPGIWLERGLRHARQQLRPRDLAAREILLVRPEAGFPHMYAPAVDALRASGAEVRLGSPIGGIEKRDGRFEITLGNEVVRTRDLVNTMPLQLICKYLGLAEASGLDTIDLASLFVSFDAKRGFDGSILYNWGRHGRWKRLTVHSDYYGRRHGRDYASIEIPVLGDEREDIDLLFADFVASVRQYGLLQGDLRLEGHHWTQGAYPAYFMGAGEKVARALKALDALGVRSAGRQGRFDYLPTGMHVVDQVRASLSA